MTWQSLRLGGTAHAASSGLVTLRWQSNRR